MEAQQLIDEYEASNLPSAPMYCKYCCMKVFILLIVDSRKMYILSWKTRNAHSNISIEHTSFYECKIRIYVTSL